jgi:hypothetical protein
MNGHDTTHTLFVADPGQLLAALPGALGFHPTKSLVVVCLQGTPDNTTSGLARILRADLPEPSRYASFVAWVMHTVRLDAPERAILVIVDDQTEPHTQPHSDLVTACGNALDDSGIPVSVQLWTSATTAGSPWVSGAAPITSGVVADPAEISGYTRSLADDLVYDTRDALARTLQPAEPAVLARRAALIRDLTAGDTDLPADLPGRLAYVEAAIGRAADGLLPDTDNEIARLAIILSDHLVRDAVLALPDPARMQPAEQLWAALVRGTPLPHRCEPASLLAFSAHGRGHGALAGLALEASDISHRLTELLTVAHLSMKPEQMRHAAITAARASRRNIQQEGKPHI